MRRVLLIAILSLVGVAAIGLTAWQSHASARRSIETATFDRLTSLREAKRREIGRYLDGCRDATALLADMSGVRSALVDMQVSFASLATGTDDAAALRSFYEREYLPRIVNGDAARLARTVVPDDPLAIAAQASCIVRNPHPVGEKDEMAAPADGTPYASVHAAHHDELRAVIREFGFYDLFLVDADGRIVYTVFKEIDFGTSLESGPHRDSNLAEAFRAARTAPSGRAVLVDYARYAPSYLAPAAFVAAPIRDGEQLLGVVAVQLPIDRIDAVMTGDRRWTEDGLGASGETYLVGRDEFMRSNSRFILEHPDRFLARLRDDPHAENAERMEVYRTTILFQRVSTDAALAAIGGESGTRIVADYRGIPVLSSFAPLELDGLDWAVLAEIDADEAFAPVRTLGVRVASLSAFVAVLFIGLAVGMATVVSRNERMARQRDKIENDLSVARNIQRGLLPKILPDASGYDIAGWSEPADQTGGDYFDWQRLASGRVAISLADVTGHGIGPALVTAVCRAYARASFSDSEDLRPVMERINALLHADLSDGRFITFVVAMLDTAAHRVELLSAGHAPICIYRAATGTVEMREAHHVPFGILGDLEFTESDFVDLAPGDMLVLVTDGFFEWANEARELFGIERLQASIARAARGGAQSVIDALHRDVLDFSGGTPQHDDLTAIVIKRTG